MVWNNLPIKGVGLLFALITVMSPWATLKAFAESTSTSSDVAQTSSPTPLEPSPTPATPEASPEAPASSPPSAAPAPRQTRPAVPSQAAPAPQAAPVAPADNTSLYERTDYIGVCRKTNTTTEVFSDSALTPAYRVGTFTPNTEVNLTGVLAPGRAQLLKRTSPNTIVVVGWVNAAYLTTCGGPSLRACYRVNVDNLSVRTGPSLNSGVRGSLRINSIAYATSNPPKEQTSGEGRIWSEINYVSSPGWISRTGANGVGNNATRLPDAQCGS